MSVSGNRCKKLHAKFKKSLLILGGNGKFTQCNLGMWILMRNQHNLGTFFGEALARRKSGGAIGNDPVRLKFWLDGQEFGC
ncbi:MAG: hypothetical protein FWF31_12760 [Desulfobulbus sp.]|nr:hypothetical protein [Desulfobulbus sp.]